MTHYVRIRKTLKNVIPGKLLDAYYSSFYLYLSCIILHYKKVHVKVKGKAIPVTGREGP
jgi:hypothetical protein